MDLSFKTVSQVFRHCYNLPHERQSQPGLRVKVWIEEILGPGFLGQKQLWTHLLFADLVYGSGDFGAATLGVFAVEVFLLTATTGASFGYRIVGIRLVSVSARPLNFLKVLARTALLCLAVPALIWDRDGRGLHDKVVGTILIRTR